jgi:hypothetical protein
VILSKQPTLDEINRFLIFYGKRNMSEFMTIPFDAFDYENDLKLLEIIVSNFYSIVKKYEIRYTDKVVVISKERK